jgi:hypothetical protein
VAPFCSTGLRFVGKEAANQIGTHLDVVPTTSTINRDYASMSLYCEPPLNGAQAMLRSSGMEDHKIHIEGYESESLEVFQVASALDGVAIDELTTVENVQLLPKGPVSRMADGMGPEELEKR